MLFENRWYDKNPKVSLAVDCIKDANIELRIKLAKLIITRAMEMKVTAQKSEPVFFRRWHDQDPTLSRAMEYFKSCDDNQRLEIANDIIDYIQSNIVSANSP